MSEFQLKEWESKITEVGRNTLRTFNVPQEEIIRNFSYEEMLYFLLKGHRPTANVRTILRSIIVSHISHGITGQSTLAVRMAADTGANFLNAVFAGFAAGSGIYHQGNLEVTMRELAELTKVATAEAQRMVLERLENGQRIMGFGHRFHKEQDPRAETLIQIAEEIGHSGPHFERMKAIAEIVLREKAVPTNIEAAGGALLLDIGIDPAVAHLFIIVGRAPMFAAAYLERLAEARIPFPKIRVLDEIAH